MNDMQQMMMEIINNQKKILEVLSTESRPLSSSSSLSSSLQPVVDASEMNLSSFLQDVELQALDVQSMEVQEIDGEKTSVINVIPNTLSTTTAASLLEDLGGTRSDLEDAADITEDVAEPTEEQTVAPAEEVTDSGPSSPGKVVLTDKLFWRLPISTLIGRKAEDFTLGLDRLNPLPVHDECCPYEIPQTIISHAKAVGAGHRHKYAVSLFRQIMTIGDVDGKNLTGKTYKRSQTKDKISEKKMEAIRASCFTYFPAPPNEEIKLWQYITQQLNKAIWYTQKYITSHLDISQIRM